LKLQSFLKNIFSFFSALIFPLVPVWIPTFSAGSFLFLVPALVPVSLALVPVLTIDDY
jgi:hypothetical protein